MGQQFETIQERIEGILVLIKATKKSKDRLRLLRDMRVLVDEADQLLHQNLTSPVTLPGTSDTPPAD